MVHHCKRCPNQSTHRRPPKITWGLPNRQTSETLISNRLQRSKKPSPRLTHLVWTAKPPLRRRQERATTRRATTATRAHCDQPGEQVSTQAVATPNRSRSIFSHAYAKHTKLLGAPWQWPTAALADRWTLHGQTGWHSNSAAMPPAPPEAGPNSDSRRRAQANTRALTLMPSTRKSRIGLRQSRHVFGRCPRRRWQVSSRPLIRNRCRLLVACRRAATQPSNCLVEG